jgi:hypothetical protein
MSGRIMRRVTIVLIAATAALLLAACGGGGEEGSPTPGVGNSPTSAESPIATPSRSPVASSARCGPFQEPRASYNVQITAKWKGKDRIVIEGSAHLPGPGSVNYLVCQDGEVSASVLWAREPTFENGKIEAESKVVESSVGPVFDPDAQFEVVLSILALPVQVPYFTINIPVEGKPD